MRDQINQATGATTTASGVSRRQFAGYGAAAAIGAMTGVPAVAAATRAPALTERMVSIATAEGMTDAFFVHPAEGQHPGMVMWPDMAGLRANSMAIGRRLAAQGYAVLVVDCCASGPSRDPVAANVEQRTNRDAKTFAAFLAGQDAVVAATGAYILRTVAAVPVARGLETSAFRGAQSAFLFAVAPGKRRGDKVALRDAARAAHRLAQVEVYPRAA
ncbi:MAG TPA: dienelactone hydrolase family protein [Novosphingobium sp.]|nr:dienelactone hydrolase family protein [Novosphingobium sp.]